VVSACGNEETKKRRNEKRGEEKRKKEKRQECDETALVRVFYFW